MKSYPTHSLTLDRVRDGWVIGGLRYGATVVAEHYAKRFEAMSAEGRFYPFAARFLCYKDFHTLVYELVDWPG